MNLYSNYFTKGALIAFLCSSSVLLSQEDPSGYLFQGLSMSAQSGRSFFPVVKADKRKIYVDVGDGEKKVSLESPCLVRASVRVSDKFLEVLESKVVTSSLMNIHREAETVSEMHRAQGQSETHAAILKSRGSSQQEIEGVQEAGERLQSSMREGLDGRMFEGQGYVDTVYLNMELLPKADIESAYCVFALTYTAINQDTGKPVGKRRVGRVKYLGNLQSGKLVRIKRRFAMNEFSLSSSEYSLHIFSGDGEEIAMSNSRGIKELSEAEMELIRDAMH